MAINMANFTTMNRRVNVAEFNDAKPAASVVGCMEGTLTIHGDLTDPCIPESDREMRR